MRELLLRVKVQLCALVCVPAARRSRPLELPELRATRAGEDLSEKVHCASVRTREVSGGRKVWCLGKMRGTRMAASDSPSVGTTSPSVSECN